MAGRGGVDVDRDTWKGPLWAVRSRLNRPVAGGRPWRPAPIAGRCVLVTGASSGIGRATAVRLAAGGAHVLAVARRRPELEDVVDEITVAGGRAACRLCDLADEDDTEALVRWAVEDHGGVDVLVNMAGRSIRRSVLDSADRLHDFRRTLAVNYVGAVQLTLGLVPGMVERGSGHIVNVGTWTVPAGTSPRFAAYHGSKMAIAGFGRCLDAELGGRGVRVTEVHYPLVHTEMSARNYRHLPGLSAEEAAAWIETAIRRRPVRIVPRYAALLGVLGVAAPRSLGRILLRWG